MVIVRNVFRLKFGKAREAVEHWNENLKVLKKIDDSFASSRVLTDLAGADFYTLVMETQHESLAAYEEASSKLSADDEWRSNYQKFVGLVESGHREIFNVVK